MLKLWRDGNLTVSLKFWTKYQSIEGHIGSYGAPPIATVSEQGGFKWEDKLISLWGDTDKLIVSPKYCPPANIGSDKGGHKRH